MDVTLTERQYASPLRIPRNVLAVQVGAVDLSRETDCINVDMTLSQQVHLCSSMNTFICIKQTKVFSISWRPNIVRNAGLFLFEDDSRSNLNKRNQPEVRRTRSEYDENLL